MRYPFKRFGDKTLKQIPFSEYGFDGSLILEENEKQPGLYFITCPCDSEGYYYVKIGQAINVYNRIKQYQTYNPAIVHFGDDGFLPVKKNNLDLYESNCHNYLAKFAIGLAEGSHEWFILKEKEFDIICNSFTTTLYNNRFLQIAQGLYK